ncbi:Ammonia transport outward protein 2 [Grifola frondosa]|uniref:Ammonia transport outward protein 2 n=1 Tax=Grifola frondosa TaxID=5627 RepID=A0A1C7MSE9_GRIFR|nr:Ammonia transport outward protein 2 [Grifola frondosa]
MSNMSHLEKAETDVVTARSPQEVLGLPTPQYYRTLGNPGPLGVFGFASTTFLLSMYNVQVRGIAAPNVVVGMALFVGGLAQFIAGMWEFACNNTFGATAFSLYGGFWMSYASIFIPASNIVAAFAGDEKELASALGIYLITWMIITILLLIATLRRSICFIALFFFLTVTFALLASANFSSTMSLPLQKAGGAFGLITALIAFYIGLAEILTPETSWFVLPQGKIAKRVD